MRRELTDLMGPGIVKPSGPGIWLVHEASREPYVVAVGPTPIDDRIHFRRTLENWDTAALLDTWPTTDYPESDIACWRIGSL